MGHVDRATLRKSQIPQELDLHSMSSVLETLNQRETRVVSILST